MYGGERRMLDTPIREAMRGTEVERSDGIGRALSGLSCRQERQERDGSEVGEKHFLKGENKGNIIDFYTQTHTLIHALNVQKKNKNKKTS